MPDLAYWIAINEFGKFGPVSFGKLAEFFDSMEEAFKADANKLTLAGIPKKKAEQFVHFRQSVDPARLLDEMNRNGIRAVTVKDEDYPPLLRTIHDPPALLFIQGELPPGDGAHLGVVGSRKASNYGLRVASRLSEELARAGLIIVSGLAYGVDEAAHRATLKAEGTTLAILGCGLLNIGTSRQRYLAADIRERKGAIISEFPLRMPGLGPNYPYRNRIISGMSIGTLVIEATEKSGSLITARSALDQNRDVFAVPGPIDAETSVGTNNLIKMGAYAVTEAADILNVLKIEGAREIEKPKPKPDSKEEAAILEWLAKQPIHIDELTRSTGMDTKKVAQTLSLMEMKGRAHHVGGMYYVLG